MEATYAWLYSNICCEMYDYYTNYFKNNTIEPTQINIVITLILTITENWSIVMRHLFYLLLVR
jgi:hypothetical protein